MAPTSDPHESGDVDPNVLAGAEEERHDDQEPDAVLDGFASRFQKARRAEPEKRESDPFGSESFDDFIAEPLERDRPLGVAAPVREQKKTLMSFSTSWASAARGRFRTWISATRRDVSRAEKWILDRARSVVKILSIFFI
jgi:hypothetical protein